MQAELGITGVPEALVDNWTRAKREASAAIASARALSSRDKVERGAGSSCDADVQDACPAVASLTDSLLTAQATMDVSGTIYEEGKGLASMVAPSTAALSQVRFYSAGQSLPCWCFGCWRLDQECC
jgi:hypothetical protein